MKLRQIIHENLFCDEPQNLWLINFSGYEHEANSLLLLLDSEEKKRTAAYKLHDKVLAFIIAHGFMRLLLSAILHIPSQELKFLRGVYGKPYLAQVPEIAFNLSYSKQFILFGYTTKGLLGLDIESIQKLPAMPQLIEQHFHPDEKASLIKLTGDEKIKQFYRIWTCKEAYIKALGTGLSLSLNSFAVDLEQSASIKGQNDWFLHKFEFEENYFAAVASNQTKAPRLIRI